MPRFRAVAPLTKFAPLPIDRLVCDGPLPAALYEPADSVRGAKRGGKAVLLLAKGATVTPETLDRLRERGVTDLIVDTQFLDALRRPDLGETAERPREPVAVAADRRIPADALVRQLTRPAGPITPERERAAAARRDALRDGLGALFPGAQLTGAQLTGVGPAASGSGGARGDGDRRGAAGRGSDRIDGKRLRALSEQSVADLCGDFDLFTAVGLARPADGSPTRLAEPTDGNGARPPSAAALGRLRTHAVRTAHLALAIGVTAGLRRWELEQLAMGCLVHDAGMTRLDAALWDHPDPLDHAGVAAVAEHPRHTLELLRGIPDVPPAARAVAVQMHERADGSGYPFRLRGGRVNRLARLASLADAYCGMTADRPHRSALSSHAAVRALAAETLRRKFDPDAFRAFLEAVGVFPPGTAVVLSDGRCGRVVQAAPDRPAGPRIELWDPFDDCFTGEIVDLADCADRPRVVSARESVRAAPAAT